MTYRFNIDIIYYEMLEFEWDEIKNIINRQKHGIWFEEAQTVFSDIYGRLFMDNRHYDEEGRFILVGYSNVNRLLIVTHCYREVDTIVRIISARKATKKERSFYEERI